MLRVVPVLPTSGSRPIAGSSGHWNAWLPHEPVIPVETLILVEYLSKLKGQIGNAFAVSVRTENENSAKSAFWSV